MSIRTRLFLGTTALVLALVAVQWWLQSRQLAGLQRELASVAASVGEGLILSEPQTATVTALDLPSASAVWVPEAPPKGDDSHGTSFTAATTPSVQWEIRQHESKSAKVDVYFRKVFVRHVEEAMAASTAEARPADGHVSHSVVVEAAAPDGSRVVTRSPISFTADQIELEVVAEGTPRQNVLILRSEPGGERRVTIPAAPAERLIRSTFSHGLLASGLLLLVGIGGAAAISHHVTRPLRQLSQGVETVGMGGFGTTVPVTAVGEVGELQQRFNTMSSRLATLEREKESWTAREHLAELGALARGLAHTLRNPLNTLGLVVEELAERGGAHQAPMAATARHQIRRIDRWLLSFLALGSGRAAAAEIIDVRDLVRSVVLDLTQEGGNVVLVADAERLVVRAVPDALRAAVANLVENAVQASPEGGEVRVMVCRDAGRAAIVVADRGSGIAPEVREKLFTPHVTTKADGAGMGLFIARQLVEAGHGGTLELRDGDAGGTDAVVLLPLLGSDDGGDGR